MSNARVLEFGAITDLGVLSFPDLKARLEGDLESVKALPDLEILLGELNPLLKDGRFNEEEQAFFKKLRQRAYDRKRYQKFEIIKAPKVEAQTIKVITVEKTMQPVTIKNKPESFGEGIARTLSTLSGERFIKTAPAMPCWFSASVLISYLLWRQSLSLYESAGFKDSTWASAGGILMIIGFAAYHSITRSILALILCIYASGYEAYLMISGTITDEHQIQIQTVQTDPDLEMVKEKASKSVGHYHELKARYDDPESKVFKNEWFLKTHLNPAWQESLAAHDELMAKEATLGAAVGSNHVTWLKIFYRLGLVFLCMMLVHRFFNVFRK